MTGPFMAALGSCSSFFFFNDTATTEIYTLSLHDALPITRPSGVARRARSARRSRRSRPHGRTARPGVRTAGPSRSPRPTRDASQERARPGNRRARQGKKGDALRRRRQSPKKDPRRTPTSSQLQLPGLGDEVLAEAVVLLLAHDAEARRLVQASSREIGRAHV